MGIEGNQKEKPGRIGLLPIRDNKARLLFALVLLPLFSLMVFLLVFWAFGGFSEEIGRLDEHFDLSPFDLAFRMSLWIAVIGAVVYWAFKGQIRVVAISVLIVCILGAAISGRFFRQEVHFEGQWHKNYSTDETFYVPPHGVLKTMAIGHPGFVADLLYIKALSYFVDHLFGDRRFKWLDAYVESIIALDPKVRVYRWASQTAKMGQLIDREAVEKSNAYALKGIEAYPNNWRLYLDVGFNYFFEMPKYAISEEEQTEFVDQAREYFSIAAMIPGSQLDPNFVTNLFLENNDTEMALFHAYSRYMDASEAEREELLYRIQQIENADTLEEVARGDREWKEGFPFMKQPLFQLIGHRTERRVPVSWDQLVDVYDTRSFLEGNPAGELQESEDEM